MLNLLKIKQLRKVLTQDVAHTLIRGLVSHIDYYNDIFAGLPTYRMNLQVQNAAAKLVLGWSNYASATDALKHLHSTPPIMKKNMWRFCFIIGGFSLRVTSL